MKWLQPVLFASFLSYLPFAGGAIDYQNCQQQWSVDKRPQRIVAMNQSAADMLLALQAEDLLAGVSYLDDAPDALKQGSYYGVKVIAKQYPGAELLFANKTDFVVASYISAFHSEAGDRLRLQKNGIGSYLLHDGCGRNLSTTLEDVLTDIRILGRLTGREIIAQQLTQSIQQRRAQVSTLPPLAKPPRVFYYDGGDRDIYTQGGGGFISALLAEAGARNLFADMRQKWLHVSPEMLLSQQPDIILLSDDLRQPAPDKIALMQTDPVLSELNAVKHKRFIVISFSDLYPGVNSGETLWVMAQKIRALTEM